MTVTVTATNFSGYAVPHDFVGLAFEDSKLPFGEYFNTTNTPILTLFQQMSVHSLRIGGATEDGPGYVQFGQYTVDDLFYFAATDGDLSIIFQFPLHDGNSNDDANLAQHIWTNYQSMVTAFALGNESDWQSANVPSYDPTITNYTTFLGRWNLFASAITNAATGAPGAIFAGPDTGNNLDEGAPDASNGAWAHNGTEWTTNFGFNQKNNPIVTLIDQHNYEDGAGITNANDLIEAIISPAWDTVTNQTLYNKMASPILADGLPYRFTETDESDVGGGVEGASDAFVAAIWALDFMHWWAQHKCAGVNFENSQPKPNNVITTNNTIYPKGYALKAFDLGGHGYEMSITNSSNPENLDVTSYAVGRAQDLYVTIINKERGSGGTNATVTIVPSGFTAGSVATMVMTAPSGFTALTGTTLGGGIITNNARWQGIWTNCPPVTSGACTVTVAKATAVVVYIRAGCAYVGPIQINNDGNLEMFGTGTNGDVWHEYQKDGAIPGGSASNPTNWSTWQDLGAFGTGATTISGELTVAKNLDGTLEIFASGSDGNIYDDYQMSPGAGPWSGWINMGGPSLSDLQAANNSDGSLSLFGLDSNGNLWCNSEFAPGVDWTGWTNIGGPNSGPLEPGYRVAQNLDGIMEIFGTDTNSFVWHNYQTTGDGSWTGWQSLGNTPVNPQIQVARNIDGRLELFGIGTNGYLWHDWQEIPGTNSWSGWDGNDFTNATGGVYEGVNPGFVVAENSDGLLEVFTVANDGNVWHDYEKTFGPTNYSWSYWYNLGGSGTANLNPQLAVANTDDGRLQVFGVGQDTNVWSSWQSAPGGGTWNAWTNFGGNVMFYPGQP